MSNDEEHSGEERLPDDRLIRRPLDHAESPGAATDEDGLTEAQIQEAERRLQEYERNPVPYSTWEEVKKRLLEGR
jgi:putative addiction module component (TIGR02574 family)